MNENPNRMSIHSTPKRKIGNYFLYKMIGEGQYGQVYEGYDIRDETKIYAIKRIPKGRVKDEELRRELFMYNVISPYVVFLKDHIPSQTSYYLVQELCVGGTLKQYMEKHGKLNEQQASKWFSQLIQGLNSLSQTNICHRDIKPENILLDEDSEDAILKITDFGLCNLFSQNFMLMSVKGSPCYAAPELLTGQQYDLKVDVWSAGLLLYFMITGYVPFSHIVSMEQLIEASKLGLYGLQWPPGISNELSQEMQDFFLKVLEANPQKRFSVNDCLNHPFVLNALQNPQYRRSSSMRQSGYNGEQAQESAVTDNKQVSYEQQYEQTNQMRDTYNQANNESPGSAQQQNSAFNEYAAVPVSQQYGYQQQPPLNNQQQPSMNTGGYPAATYQQNTNMPYGGQVQMDMNGQQQGVYVNQYQPGMPGNYAEPVWSQGQMPSQQPVLEQQQAVMPMQPYPYPQNQFQQ